MNNSNQLTGIASLEDNLVFISNDGSYMAEMWIKNSVQGAVRFMMTNFGLIPTIDPQQTKNVSVGKIFAHGSVSITAAFRSERTGELKATLCVRSANPSQPCKYLDVSIDEFYFSGTKLRDALLRAGMDFVNNASYGRILRFLRFAYSSIDKVSLKKEGFYMDENRLLNYSNAESTLKTLPSHSTAEQLLNLQDGAKGSLFPYCLWALDEVRHITGYIPPMLVVVSSNPIEITNEFGRVMKVQPCADPLKLDSHVCYERPLVCDLSGLSDYKKRSAARILSQLSERNTVVAVVRDARIISDEIIDGNSVYLPLSEIKLTDSEAIRAIIVDAFLHSSDLIECLKKCGNADSYEEIEERFVNALMCVADCVLSRIQDDDKSVRKLISEFKKYIKNNLDNIEATGKRILREYLAGRNYAVSEKSKVDEIFYNSTGVAYSGASLYLMPPAMKEAAASGGISCESLCSDLKGEGVLHAPVKNQVKIFANGFEGRAYKILQDKLYEPFQLRFQTRDLIGRKPQLKICIGEAEGVPLYLNSSECAADDNLNIAVLGNSGSGKTWWQRNYALGAAANGCVVITLCVKSLRYKILMPDADTVDLKRSMINDYGVCISDIIDVAVCSGEFFEEESDLLIDVSKSCEDMCVSDIISAVEILKKLLPDSDISEHLRNILDDLYDRGVFENNSDFLSHLYAGNTVNFVVEDRDVFNTKDQRSVIDLLIERVILMKQNGIIDAPVFFMIDEATNFDLSQNSGIVKLILRQGRSLGIATVIAAQSFTAENARNIRHALNQCGTFVAFDIADDSEVLRHFGVKSDDTERRNMITNRTRYSFLAQGALATETSSVNYPVFGTLSEKQLKVLFRKTEQIK